MNKPSEDPSFSSPSLVNRIDRVCDAFESAWQEGQSPQIEAYLDQCAESEQSCLLRELLRLEIDYRRQAGETVVAEDYFHRFPEHRETVQSVLSSEPMETKTFDERSTDGSPRPSEAPRFVPGNKLGKYELVEQIGQGAFGWVYRARDLELDREVAIKIPRAGTLVDEEDAHRFLREARAAGQLRHPNIVPIYDAGEIDGTCYIASAFVAGQSMRDHVNQQGSLPRRECVELLATLAATLDYAHSNGVIHRDVKPENVVIDEAGRPHVMDFGLARRNAAAELQTQEGMRMGTPAYMSPEQAAGQSHLADRRSDLWALGVILYELLTGQRPFRGEVLELIRVIREEEPIRPQRLEKTIPRDLETICLKCLAKSPGQRYETCGELAEELRRWLRNEPIAARRVSSGERLWRWCQRKPITAGLVVTAICAVFAFSGAVYFAERAHASRELTNAIKTFQNGLNQREWTEQHLTNLDGMVEVIRQHAPDEADGAEQHLISTLEGHCDAMIQDEQRLTPNRIETIQTALRLLAERAPTLAERLEQTLQDRRSQFQTALQIAQPFEGIEHVFSDTQLSIDGDGLKHGGAGESIVLTNVASRGPSMLEAEFGVGWDQGNEIGLIIHGQAKGGYRFLVNRDDEATKRSVSATLDTTASGQRLYRLEIYRNGQKLARKLVLAEELEEQPLRLNATIEDNLLTFRVNRSIEVACLEYFPLALHEKVAFGLVWPTGVSLRWLLGARKELPVVPSLLEKADRLYVEGQFEQALVEYRLASANAANTEAIVKQGVCEVALGQTESAARHLNIVIVRETEPHSTFARCQLIGLELQRHQYEAVDQLLSTMLLSGSRQREGDAPIATVMPEDIRQRLEARPKTSEHLKAILPEIACAVRAHVEPTLADAA